ncbi:ubiquinol-cytochrome-c reductase cytochrome c1 [Ophiocordyceps camponoti-floridani]|uniref:Ubiquinol-cytochrome-c reductase cytochrome c1 n=1 Tax=Ophiocordyceps camponoti-floridani TaxID=2030778 RepID=A0A8H4VBJ2_9HYPO|nr:ubiquinol-cytochrome-c reductase cytochrome c1 [Ophiocordyceps camponoti-floridani]
MEESITRTDDDDIRKTPGTLRHIVIELASRYPPIRNCEENSAGGGLHNRPALKRMLKTMASRSLPRMACRIQGPSSRFPRSKIVCRGVGARFYSEGQAAAVQPTTEPSSPAQAPKAEDPADATGKETVKPSREAEQAIYNVLKEFFVGNGPSTRPRHVRKVFEKHKSETKMSTLLEKYNTETVYKVAYGLMSDGIFSSASKAEARFSKTRKVKSGTKREDSTTEEGQEVREGQDDQTGKEASELAQNLAHDESVTATGTLFTTDILKVVKANSTATSTPAETETDAPTATPSEPSPRPTAKVVAIPVPVSAEAVLSGPLRVPGPIVMPVLETPQPEPVEAPNPVFIPIPAQHQLLTHLQQLLEIACFEFCKRSMPEVLEQNNWEYPEAVELQRWMEEFLRRRSKFPETQKGTGKAIRTLFSAACDLRHTTVHRLPIETWRLGEFFALAEGLLVVLGDVVRADEAAKLRYQMQGVIEELERNKRSQQRELDDISRRIASQRSELMLLETRAKLEIARMGKEAEIVAGNKVLRFMSSGGYRSFQRTDGGGSTDGVQEKMQPEARVEAKAESKPETPATEARTDNVAEARAGTRPEKPSLEKAQEPTKNGVQDKSATESTSGDGIAKASGDGIAKASGDDIAKAIRVKLIKRKSLSTAMEAAADANRRATAAREKLKATESQESSLRAKEVATAQAKTEPQAEEAKEDATGRDLKDEAKLEKAGDVEKAEAERQAVEAQAKDGSDTKPENDVTTEGEKSKGRWWLPSFLTFRK